MSQMYAELKTLQARGWVSATVKLQGARPAKKIFTLTPTGRATFQNWMTTPSQGLREMRVEFIARLYFARRESTQAVTALITCQEKSLREELDKLKKSKLAQTESDDFGRAIHSFRASQIKAALAWLKTTRKLAVRR
jgi:PadR family transcriptional regulator AphA